MSSKTNLKNTFRPSLSESPLEARLVLSGNKAAAIVAAAVSPAPAPSPFTPMGNIRLTAQQLRTDFLRANQASTSALGQAIRSDLSQLYVTGKPTAQQLNNFNAQVTGAVDALALRVSSQAALLPGQTTNLLSRLQNSLMGNGSTSLVNRIAGLTQSSRLTNSLSALQSAVMRQVNQSGLVGAQNLNNFFNTTSINRLSVNATGQSIPLQQFIGNGLAKQFANNLGSLASAYSSAAGSLFFNGNGVTPSTAAVNAFQNQTAQALGVVTSTLGNDLSVLGNTATQVVPQIANAFYAPGTNVSSFFNSIVAAFPSNLPGVGPSTTNPFNGPFGTVGPLLLGQFGLPSATNQTLTSGPFSSVLGSALTGNNFNSGFNNGFGSGFIGFGTAPNTFNTSFSTGFNNLISSVNQSLGFNQPAIPTTTTV